jgi:ferritin-like metal-binding protein YciE
MGIFTKDIKTMEDLFLHQLEDIYYAEQQLTKAIPKMADMATNADLKAGLKSHVIDTKNQIERLDKVFAKLGKQPKGTDCPAIDGLIKEADETAGEIEDKAVLDAAIVANSQAVEHYEGGQHQAEYCGDPQGRQQESLCCVGRMYPTTKKRPRLVRGLFIWSDVLSFAFAKNARSPNQAKIYVVLRHPKSTSGQRTLHKFAPAHAPRQVQSTARSTSPRLSRRTDGRDTRGH